MGETNKMTTEIETEKMLEAKIKLAIHTKYPIEFDYKKEGKREGNPHCLYWNNKNEFMVDMFQTCGHSETGKQGWKQFKIDNITDLVVIKKMVFETHRQFHPESPRYINLIRMVK